jgi:hypothetical protein
MLGSMGELQVLETLRQSNGESLRGGIDYAGDWK